jgi:hypothetical protein
VQTIHGLLVLVVAMAFVDSVSLHLDAKVFTIDTITEHTSEQPHPTSKGHHSQITADFLFSSSQSIKKTRKMSL